MRPVAVRGSRSYFVWQNSGGSRVQFLEFLQHSVCTGTLYSVLIRVISTRTQGADLIQRGGIALGTATAAAAKAAAGALPPPPPPKTMTTVTRVSPTLVTC